MSKVKSYLWTLLGKFGSQIIYLLTNVLLARILTPEDFGTIGIVSIIFSVAATLSDTGLGGALMLEKKLTKENCGTVFLFNFAVSNLLFLLVFFCAPYVESFYEVDGLSLIVKLLSLVFVIHAWSIVPKNILIYQLKFKECTIITLASVFIASLMSVGLAYYGAGVYALVAYQIIQALLAAVLLFKYSHFTFNFKFDRQVFKRLFGFGVFTTATSLVDSIYENLITSIFGKFVSINQAGYFFQSKKLEEASTRSLMSTINSTTFPILSKIRHDKTVFMKDAKMLQDSVVLLLAPVLIFMGVYSREVIKIVYGEKWLEAAPYLSMLLVAGYFMIAESLNRSFIKSLGEVKQLFLFTLLKRIIGISLIVLFAFVSVNNILYAYVLSAIIGYLTNSYVYSRILNVSIVKIILDSSLVFIFSGCLLFLIYVQHSFVEGYWGFLLTILICIIYYFAFLPLIGIDLIKTIKSIFK